MAEQTYDRPMLVEVLLDFTRSRIFQGEEIPLKSVKKFRQYGKILVVPDEFFDEIEAFAERNTIPLKDSSYEDIETCCLRCFKAHVLKTAEKTDMPELLKEFFAQQFQCETGHHGYYIDNDKMKEI